MTEKENSYFHETGLPNKVSIYTVEGIKEIRSLSVIALLASPNLKKEFMKDPERQYCFEELVALCDFPITPKGLRRGIRETPEVFKQTAGPVTIVFKGRLKKVFLFHLKRDVVTELLTELAKNSVEIKVKIKKVK